MPRAGSFLWNPSMLLQVNCRGFAIAQHLQPDASKYSHAPVLEQQTFMQPELPLYAHHPGRFVYVRDEDSGDLFSLPHEPVRRAGESFVFSVGQSDIEWRIRQCGLESRFGVSIPADAVVEIWTLEIANPGDRVRRLNVCTCFTIGYMSWMNQSAQYRADLGGIVATSVTPYQKLEDYARVRNLKDRTFLLHDTRPDAWEASRDAFEGEGGLPDPDALRTGSLGNGDALYETPVGALQYRVTLAPGESARYRFLFGPARDAEAIAELRRRFLAPAADAACRDACGAFLARGNGCLRIATPEPWLDRFVNHWLDRQVYYHGSTNRFTADPQTRNFLQDAMGMVYIDPAAARASLSTALARQAPDGGMPEGIVLADDAELKYINRIPHTDHCVWLPICLAAYLDETADHSLLEDSIAAGDETRTVFERVTAAMRWLIRNRDSRNLSLIAQGDWCDPMNMVGSGGRGVSGWLSIATVYALRLWAGICVTVGRDGAALEMEEAAASTEAAVQELLWDGDWFARGISDGGSVFGSHRDDEGSIYLNPQSWAILAGIATPTQRRRMIAAIRDRLDTPCGAMVLAPAYTAMHEHIGRLTQKSPGVAENGSVYNHAATFYLYALLQLGEADLAFEQLTRMIPGPDEDDLLQRGQLPAFVPNYYRGAARQFPRTAGRSSQLFNTGAASWLYRCIVEGVFGLRGTPEGLAVTPRLPAHWHEASAQRRFRGAQFEVRYRRDAKANAITLTVDGQSLPGNVVTGFETGESRVVDVSLPAVSRAPGCSP